MNNNLKPGDKVKIIKESFMIHFVDEKISYYYTDPEEFDDENIYEILAISAHRVKFIFKENLFRTLDIPNDCIFNCIITDDQNMYLIDINNLEKIKLIKTSNHKLVEIEQVISKNVSSLTKVNEIMRIINES